MIAGNWKMNTTIQEASELVRLMSDGLDKVNGIDKLICPPFVSLATVAELIKGSSINLGAQNVYHVEKGAYTGEISPLMLAGMCNYCIVGHSERRQYFGETGEAIDKKVQALLKVGIKPVLCIGESLEENEAGKTEEVLTKQLLASSDRSYYLAGTVLAYEPVWAIGTGKSASADVANKTIGFIRGILSDKVDKSVADSVRILYGGSVTADNIAEFMKYPDIDGALIGGASLKADEFVNIARRTAETRGLS